MSRRRATRSRAPGLAVALLAALGLGAVGGWHLYPRYQDWRAGPRGGDPTPPSAHRPASRPSPGGSRTIARLYFCRVVEGKERLVSVRRELPAGSSPAAAALLELIEGEVPRECRRPLPKGTELRGVRATGDLATADFSRELVANFPGGSDTEGVVVYAIVDTLCSLPGITQVQILVEGERVETIGGHIETSAPLRADDELVVR